MAFSLRCSRADSLLTKEARKVVYKLPDQRELLIVIERDTSLPSQMLPSITDLMIPSGHDDDWLGCSVEMRSKR